MTHIKMHLRQRSLKNSVEGSSVITDRADIEFQETYIWHLGDSNVHREGIYAAERDPKLEPAT